jgi:hypothetical protein
MIRQELRNCRSELQREEGTAVDEDHGGATAGVNREHLAAVNHNPPSGELIVLSDVHELLANSRVVNLSVDGPDSPLTCRNGEVNPIVDTDWLKPRRWQSRHRELPVHVYHE